MVNHYIFTHILLFIKNVHIVTNIPPPEGQTLTHPAISGWVSGALPVALSQIMVRIFFLMYRLAMKAQKIITLRYAMDIQKEKCIINPVIHGFSSNLMPYFPLV